MGGIFRGWRRKTGLLALVMACMFTGGLARSLSTGDRVTFFRGDLAGESIRSDNCYLTWASWKITENPGRLLPARSSFVQWDRYPLGQNNSRTDEDEGIECRFRCLIFGFGHTDRGSMSLAFAHRIWFVSYWALVIPLTLLAAYLLLTQPRTPISKNSIESISAGFLSRWRRKVGFVTLALACVLMGVWARSFDFADRFGISEEIHPRLHFCESLNGSLRWIYFKLPDPYAETDEDVEEENADTDMVEPATIELLKPSYCGWQVKSRSNNPSHFISDDNPNSGIRLRTRFMGFGVGDVVSIDGSQSIPGTIWFIPIWSLALPLTLIALWLLLKKPIKANQEKISEPIPAEGN